MTMLGTSEDNMGIKQAPRKAGENASYLFKMMPMNCKYSQQYNTCQVNM